MSGICKWANTAEDCSDIELNGLSREIMKKFCYLGDTIGTRGGEVDSVITRIKSGIISEIYCLS